MKQLILLVAFITVHSAFYSAESLANDSAAYDAYGLLIGSNRAGTGQTKLTYAHRDARRMAQTLEDVAGFEKENMEILLDPDRESVSAAIDKVERKLAEKARLDEKTVFLFYYSGHARESGLNLGADDFSLATLKERLRKLSATVTVVLLDACQSGAISKVKGVGASPSRVFSHNSVDQLNVSGMAVIASSAGSELSQESKKLKGSYFSHHFSVGLRGAADADGNGVVTLSEAYSYAYNRTLSTTALTTTGRQHATLEMDLKGKGDMPIAWPGNFSSSLQFPSHIEGEILLTHKESGTVSAEIRKVKGKQYSVALTPGRYDGLVRKSNNQAWQCQISIGAGTKAVLDLNECAPLKLEDQSAKGAQSNEVVYRVSKRKKERRREYVMAELQLGFFHSGTSEFTDRLEDTFRYKGLADSEKIGFSGSLVGSPLPFLSIGATFATMDRREASSNLNAHEQTVSWGSFRVGGFVRGNLILRNALFVPYAQIGGGFGRATFELNWRNNSGSGVDTTVFNGAYLSGGGGIQMNPVRWFGVTLLHIAYTHAPLVNMAEFGQGFNEKHNNGGVSVFTGIRLGY